MSGTETIIVIGQGCWGKGPDLKSARRGWMRQGGVIALGYSIVTLDADTEFEGVDGWGSIHYKGNEPTSRDVAATAATR